MNEDLSNPGCETLSEPSEHESEQDGHDELTNDSSNCCNTTSESDLSDVPCAFLKCTKQHNTYFSCERLLARPSGV